MNHQTHHSDEHATETKGVISAILSALSWLFTMSNFQTTASLVLTLMAIFYNGWNLYDKWKASKSIPNPQNPNPPDEKTS